MADFEFLPAASIGQYIPTGSVVHRLAPGSKLLGYGLLILALTFTQAPIGIALGLAAVLAGLIIARIPLRFALKTLLPPLPFLVIIALIQMVFYNPSGEPPLWAWGPIAISAASIVSGLLLVVRFVALILAISLMSYTTSSTELIHGLQQILLPLTRLGLPTMDLVMVIQVALRFLPALARNAERIAKAQASRGADWGTGQRGLVSKVRQVVPLIIPLFTSSLKKAETLALAMESRAYGYKNARTSMNEYVFTWREAVFIASAAVLATVILAMMLIR